MVLFRLIFIILAIYFAYKFIFDFVLPIYRASKRVQQQFRGMQNQMNQNMGQAPTDHTSGTKTTNNPSERRSSISKDYIDFEEVN